MMRGPIGDERADPRSKGQKQVGSPATDIGKPGVESQRFKTLLAFGKFFSAIGWVVAVIGGIMLVPGLNQLARGSQFGDGMSAMVGLGTGLLVAVFGLMLVASGQGISCFVSIEGNTHSMLVAQHSILSVMRGHGQPPPPLGPFGHESGLSPTQF